MKHDVHLYATVRVKVKDVEAESHSKAMSKAIEATDLQELFNGVSNAQGLDVEYAEEIQHLLVDECIDKSYNRSRWYKWKASGAGEDDNVFEGLHPNDNLEFVRRPYKDLEIPYELPDCLRTVLQAILDKYTVTYTGGCRAFYTADEWRDKERDLGSSATAVICHDGGELSGLLNWDMFESKDGYERYEAIDKMFDAVGYHMEALSCWATGIYENK